MPRVHDSSRYGPVPTGFGVRDRLAGHDAEHEQVGERRVRRRQVEADGRRVDGGDVLEHREPLPHRGLPCRVEQRPVGGDDVLRLERRAVGERDVGAQLDRPRQTVLGRLAAGRRRARGASARLAWYSTSPSKSFAAPCSAYPASGFRSAGSSATAITIEVPSGSPEAGGAGSPVQAPTSATASSGTRRRDLLGTRPDPSRATYPRGEGLTILTSGGLVAVRVALSQITSIAVAVVEPGAWSPTR